MTNTCEAPRVVIPYGEMRRILGLPEPTFDMRMAAIGYAITSFAADAMAVATKALVAPRRTP